MHVSVYYTFIFFTSISISIFLLYYYVRYSLKIINRKIGYALASALFSDMEDLHTALLAVTVHAAFPNLLTS